MSFCPGCGNKVEDNDIFCKQCGTRLVPWKREIKEGEPIQATVAYESKSPYNRWVKAVSVIWGTLGLIGSIASGIPYYLESGLPLVLIIEILSIPISISLIMLGLFPEYVDSKIQIKAKYPEIIVGLIIVTFIISTIQPAPPEGWWNYTP